MSNLQQMVQELASKVLQDRKLHKSQRSFLFEQKRNMFNYISLASHVSYSQGFIFHKL
uniref:Uncharacterized protein n=1 Tax=Arundo donax TaxID=35708 RepID=A0A0A9CXP8_ARUDO